MAIELASAYVTIIPSLRGAEGAIEKELGGLDLGGVGQDVGKSVTKGFSKQLSGMGQRLTGIGQNLTKAITVPIVGATVAAGGLTAALGWGRLTSIDAAQGQLKGLGYEAGDVARITDQLSTDLEGGMLDMGQATSAAASAMAAGVEEGAELTKYIQTLDSAVVGGTGSFDEMNQIFARIQGTGKLTRQEFDMIEQRMPGFGASIEDSMGVSTDAMYDMLSAGEITSSEFIDIMDSFAGDMAKEYAKTWPGMVQNTKAWIGIIGEQLLGGVFEQSKESLSEFIEFLSSDEVIAWAAEIGESLGNAFSSLVDNIQGVLTWFMELSPGMQKVIGGLVGLAAAAGPFLLIAGKLLTGAAGMVATFQSLNTGLSAAGGLAGVLPRIGRGLLMILGPIGLVAAGFMLFNAAGGDVGAIADGIQDMAARVIAAIPGLVDTVVSAIPGIISGIVEAIPALLAAGQEILGSLIQGVITALPLLLEGATAIITGLLNAITVALPMLLEVGVQVLTGLIQGIVTALPIILEIGLQLLMTLIQGIIEALPVLIETAISLVTFLIEALVQAIPLLLGAGLTLLMGLIDGLLVALPLLIEAAVTLVTQLMTALVENLPLIIDAGIQLLTGLITGLIDMLPQLITAALTLVTSLMTALIDNLPLIISAGIELLLGLIDGLINMIPQLIGAALLLVTELMTGLISNIPMIITAGIELLVALITGLIQAIPQLIGAIPDIISAIWDTLAEVDWLSLGKDIVSGIIDGLVSMGSSLITSIVDMASDAFGAIKNFFGINSPSRLMRDEIGEMLGAGMSIGIDRSAGDAEDSALDMSRTVLGAAELETDAEDVRLGLRLTDEDLKPAAVRSPVMAEPETQRGGDNVFHAPLLSVDNLTVDSDERVKQLSQALFRRAEDAKRADGKVNLGGAVR